MQRQERSSQETIVQPSGRVLVPPRGIHRAISLRSSAELKLPTNGRRNTLDKVSFISERSQFGNPENQRSLSRDHLKPDQKNAGPVHPDPYQQPCSSKTAIKFLAKFPLPPSLGHTFFEGTSLLCPPFACKAIKLLFSTFTPNFIVSETPFGTSEQRLGSWHYPKQSPDDSLPLLSADTEGQPFTDTASFNLPSGPVENYYHPHFTSKEIKA